MKRTPSTPKPDAWLQLVLATMSVDELRHELKSATGDQRTWLAAELAKRTKAGAR